MDGVGIRESQKGNALKGEQRHPQGQPVCIMKVKFKDSEDI